MIGFSKLTSQKGNNITEVTKMLFRGKVASQNLRRHIPTGKWHRRICGGIFPRENGIAEFAETYSRRKMALQNLRKHIPAGKWHCRICGSIFLRENGIGKNGVGIYPRESDIAEFAEA